MRKIILSILIVLLVLPSVFASSSSQGQGATQVNIKNSALSTGRLYLIVEVGSSPTVFLTSSTTMPINTQAPVWDLISGKSYTLNFTWNTVGSPTWSQADNVNIIATLTTSQGTSFGSTQWNPNLAGADSGMLTHTFNFTTDPLGSTNTNTSGMLFINICVWRTAVVSYAPSCSNSTFTVPTGADGVFMNNGYYRANNSITSVTVTNGTSQQNPFAYTDQTVNTFNFKNQWVRPYSFTFKHQQNNADVRSQTSSISTASNTWTWNNNAVGVGGAGRINKDYLKSSSGVDLKFIYGSETQQNFLTCCIPDREVIFDSVPSPFQNNGTLVNNSSFFIADPRINFTTLLQVNDNTFGTPPTSKNIANGNRLNSDLAFVSARVTNARSEGVSSLTWNERLQDSGSLVSALTQSSTATTQGGQVGWDTSFLTWSNSLPSGKWIYNQTISSTDAVGLDVNNQTNFTLLAQDPAIKLVGGFGNYMSNKDVLIYSGHPVLVGSLLQKYNGTSSVELTPDTNSAKFTIGYFNDTSAVTYFLNSTYQFQQYAGQYYYFPMSQSAGDANVSYLVFDGANTSTWPYGDYIVNFVSASNGVTYQATSQMRVKAPPAVDPQFSDCTQTQMQNRNISCTMQLSYLNATPLSGQSPTINITWPDLTTTQTTMTEVLAGSGNYRYSFNATQVGVYLIRMNNTLSNTNYFTTKYANVQSIFGLTPEQNATLYAVFNYVNTNSTTLVNGQTSLNTTLHNALASNFSNTNTKIDNVNTSIYNLVALYGNITNSSYNYLTGFVTTGINNINSTVNSISTIVTNIQSVLNSLDTYLRNAWGSFTASHILGNLTIIQQVQLNGSTNVTVGNVTANVNATQIANALCSTLNGYWPNGTAIGVCEQINQTYRVRGVGSTL